MTPCEGADTRPRLILVGGGHAHVALWQRHPGLLEHYDVTLVAPHAPRRGGAALNAVLRGSGHVGSLRCVVPEAVRTLTSRAIACQPVHRRLWLVDGQRLGYDVLSLAIGQRRLPRWVETRLTGAPRIWSGHSAYQMARLAVSLDRTDGSQRLVVVGDTRLALELAAALRARRREDNDRSPRHAVTLLCSCSRPAAREIAKAHAALAAEGVDVIRGAAVCGAGSGAVNTDDGRRFAADHLLWAGESEPPALLQASRLALTPTGVQVDRHLKVAAHRVTGLYALGGCAGVKEQQAVPGWDADRQADCLARQLTTDSDGTTAPRYRLPRRELPILLTDHAIPALPGRRWWSFRR